MSVFRSVVVPLLSAYFLLVGVVLYAARHPAGRERAPVVWPARLKLIGVTVGGGYISFLAIVLVFHVWVVGDKGAMRSALGTGVFLAATSAVTFVLLSLVEAGQYRRDVRRTGSAEARE